MKITIEDERLIYISLAEPGQYKIQETHADIDGQLLYDMDGNWIGVRFPEGHSLSFVSHPFIEKGHDLLFTAEVGPSQFYEQEFIVDVAKEGIMGIEIILYPSIPAGKLKWIESIAVIR